LEHIFERFYRVDKARSRQTGGSGLGLAIVRDMVVRNRGEITVSSTLGKGTTFKVTFPAFETGEELE
jgi:signal transduction histidine kinase